LGCGAKSCFKPTRGSAESEFFAEIPGYDEELQTHEGFG